MKGLAEEYAARHFAPHDYIIESHVMPVWLMDGTLQLASANHWDIPTLTVRLAKAYAISVRGHVEVVFEEGDEAPGSHWHTVELPELTRNPNCESITKVYLRRGQLELGRNVHLWARGDAPIGVVPRG